MKLHLFFFFVLNISKENSYCGKLNYVSVVIKQRLGRGRILMFWVIWK